MSTRDPFIRKNEKRPTRNPKRVAILFAAYSAISAAVLGFVILNQSADVEQPPQIVTVEAETETIVVAKHDLVYGAKLKPSDLKLVKWPKKALPRRAFRDIDALFDGNGDRYLMARIVENEVMLPRKLSDPGRKATLAALLRKDTRAVAVQVDEVLGVSGFVRPGDFVDVLMTRSTRETQKEEHYTVVLLQQVHVLGVDLTSRVTSDVSDAVKRAPKTVTLEVDLAGAQKLALGSQVGRLSLALRRLSGNTIPDAPRISLADLGRETLEHTQGQLQLAAAIQPVAAQPAAPVKRRRTKMIGVTRAVERTEQEVVQEHPTNSP
ncbi:MAG: Flp pilus assembly protein CpaB [Hyphomicrobiaceae bacterium]